MKRAMRLLFAAALAACLAPAGACSSSRDDGSGTRVWKIVFLDKLDGNAAQKAELDAAWSEVQAALEDYPHVRVERIHVDAEPRQSSKFLEMHSVDKLPGLYFLDADEALLEVQEGELKASQIREIIARY
jgi:hypothetical protein